MKALQCGIDSILKRHYSELQYRQCRKFLLLLIQQKQEKPPIKKLIQNKKSGNVYLYVFLSNHTVDQQYKAMGQQKETLSAPLTVLGMVNGMIGGLILILPVYALNAGYIETLLIIFFTGIFSYYSCYLCVIHIGDQSDLDFAILRHFNGNRWVKIFYDFCVWSNLMLIDILYFELIVAQWVGLIPPHEFSVINVAVNAAVLFIFVFVLKYFQFGASIMAYGIISIISYMIFLIWVVATYNQGYNDTEYTAFGSGGITLAAAMGQAFSIQSFFIPVLKKNDKPEKYIFYTMVAYILGASAYYYIAYMGSIGIWHRQYVQQYGSQTIEDYFGTSVWQVNIIEGVYLIHLYSVFPQFMLISKKRMFGIFMIQQSAAKKVNLPEIIYFALMVAICFVMGFFQININDIIDINGAVIGFFFIYLIPAVLHIKCMYFSKGKMPIPRIEFKIQSIDVKQQKEGNNEPIVRNSQIEIIKTVNVKQDTSIQKNDNKSQIQQKLLPKQSNEEQVVKKEDDSKSEQSVPKLTGPVQNTIQISEKDIQNSYYYCDCNRQTYSTKRLVLDWILIVSMVSLGIFILVNGIYVVVI